MHLESLYFREPTYNQTPEYCILSMIEGSKPLINSRPKDLDGRSWLHHAFTELVLWNWEFGCVVTERT